MVKITWLEHAVFQIEIADKLALIDPRLEGNPTESIKPSDMKQADIAYVTNDHNDYPVR